MARKQRPSSPSSRGTQLAGISDALAKASQRRDEEARKAVQRTGSLSEVSTATANANAKADALVYVAEAVGKAGEGASAGGLGGLGGGFDGVGEKVVEDSKEEKKSRVLSCEADREKGDGCGERFGRLVDKMEKMLICEEGEVGREIDRQSVEEFREKKTHNGADEMVIEHDEDLLRASSESGADQVSRRTKGSNTPALEISMSSLRTSDASLPYDDPAVLLAELATLSGATYKSAVQQDDNSYKDDIRRMLADLDQCSSTTHTAAAVSPTDDPRQMLAVLAVSSATATPATKPSIISVSEDEQGDEDKDLALLRLRLDSLRPPPDQKPSQTPSSSNENEIARAVAHAESRLQSLIAAELAAEHLLRVQAEETQLQRRVVVSNLAAGAGKEEVERLFWGVRWDVTHISLLRRDPHSRTQTAHVDFASREAALCAADVGGQVFGLRVCVGLASAGGGGDGAGGGSDG